MKSQLSGTDDKKHHLSRLIISSDAIRSNVRFFRSIISADCAIMLMVKASAYGNGAIDIARMAQEEKLAEYLAVAYVDEGIELREAGIKLPILVLNPSQNAFKAMVDFCLEPEIHSLPLLHLFEDFLENKGLGQGNYPIHIKVNTGMNRLGMDENELTLLIEKLKSPIGWEVRSVMTHLSCSGIPEEDKFTLKQLTLFDRLIKKMKPFLPQSCWFHALNSNGTHRFPDYCYQMIRLGIGMYGGSAVPELIEKLNPICKLTTKIAQIRRVRKGESISYARSGRAEKDTTIATLSIGYADGFSRNLGNANWQVEIQNKLYPTIGNICMDLSMVDLGNDEVDIDEEVVIFGGAKSIYEYAEAQGTITYEAMTNISTRVKRIII